MPVTLTETVNPLARDTWQPPELTAIAPEQEPWAGVPAWWRENIAGRPIDRDRTERLADDDLPIGTAAGNPPYKGTSYGMPYHLVDSTGPKTPVWDLSQPITLRGFTPVLPIVDTPLPPFVRREGDPGENPFDGHAYFFDPVKQVLWEAMQLTNPPAARWYWARPNRFRTLGRCDWAAGYHEKGRVGGGIVQWDCRKPWADPGQPRGLVAAGIPQFPLLPRWDEIQRGRISHALFLAVRNYAPEVTGPARTTDGHADGHHLRAGERLRLPIEMVGEYQPGSAARIFATALAEFGAIVGDTAPGAGIAMTQDRRWAQGDDRIGPLGDLGLRISDLVVVRS